MTDDRASVLRRAAGEREGLTSCDDDAARAEAEATTGALRRAAGATKPNHDKEGP